MEQQTKSLQKYYYYLIRQNIVDAERLEGIKNHYKKLCEEKIYPAEKLRLDELYCQCRNETKRSFYDEKLNTNKIISKMKPNVMLTMTFDNNSLGDDFCHQRLEELLKRLNKMDFPAFTRHLLLLKNTLLQT
jgi:hypothetical protein